MSRKSTGFIFALTACLMAGCSAKGHTASVSQPLKENFQTGITMELEDLTAEGTLSRYGLGEWNLIFSEPSQLAGVQLAFAEGDVTASYKGLEFSVPQIALPAKSIMMNFISVIDKLATQETIEGVSDEDGIQVTGELESGNYVLILQDDGSPFSFQMENMNATIVFHDFTTNATTSPSTEENISETTTISEASTEESNLEETTVLAE
ncbi:MAG: hypothetical protein IJZ64_05340 [Ruminococcus sp.]|nr:hypothetical protein [Ruminococcus sp.]